MQWRLRTRKIVLESIAFHEHFRERRLAQVPRFSINRIALFIYPLLDLELIKKAFVDEIKNQSALILISL